MNVGRVVGAHGLRGHVKVESYTEFMERFAPGTEVRVGERLYVIEQFALHRNRPLIKLEGVDNRTMAEELQWCEVEVEGAEEPDLEEGEILLEDFVGLRAVTEDGEDLGAVQEVLELPAHDVLVIGKLMVPLVPEFVLDVDLEAERVKVRLIPGMRPEEDPER